MSFNGCIRLLLTASIALSLSYAKRSSAQHADDDAEPKDGRTAAANSSAISDAALGVEDDLFRPGGSCSALAYLNSSQLAELIKSGFSDDHHSFCFPEEPSECAEYTSLLSGRGRLTTGEDGFHCNLQVSP